MAYGEVIEDHLETEVTNGALLGPFTAKQDREDKSCDHRYVIFESTFHKFVIIDMSFPNQHSIYFGIPKETYLGQYVQLVIALGHNSYIYISDLSQAYRQLHNDPLDWGLMGLIWAGLYYVDTSICFGLRTGTTFCQDTTNAVAYIMTHEGHILLVYLDDMADIANTLVVAWQGYRWLKALLKELGLEEAENTGQPPGGDGLVLSLIPG